MLKINRQLKIPAIRRCNGMYKQYMNTEATASNVVGILRENHNMWERRAPLTPTQVRKIVESQPQQIKVLVQPCTRRVFSDREYEDAGAIITDDLSGASLIFGVKAPKAKDLQANKSYMFFSHVIKAQPYSMPLLDTILEKNIDLYDYECITEKGRDDTKRLVAFGQFAGQAGMINGLQGLGLRLLADGYNTSLLNIANCYTYESLEGAKSDIKLAGERLAQEGLAEPIAVAFTGSGNVAKGAKDIFELLPHEYISVSELHSLQYDIQIGKRSKNKLYGVLVNLSDMVTLKGNKALSSNTFDKMHYYQYPKEYDSIFETTVLPHITMLVNGMYWEGRFPRLITNERFLKLRSTGNKKFKMLADITCDIGGSVQFMNRATTLEHPYFSYSPEKSNNVHDESIKSSTSEPLVDPDGVLVLGVDNLPSALPREASTHFGSALLPLILPVLAIPNAFIGNNKDRFPEELKRANVASGGKLLPKWTYIHRLRAQAVSEEEHAKGKGIPSQELRYSLKLEMTGHVFDTGLINKVLDLTEAHEDSGLEFSILNCNVGPNTSAGPKLSNIIMEIKGKDNKDLEVIAGKIKKLVESHPLAQGSVKILNKSTIKLSKPSKKILLFGSGRVAKPVLKLFNSLTDTTDSYEFTIASDSESQAHDLLSVLSGDNSGKYVNYVVPHDNHRLPDLVKNCDVAISLLPATMHMPIAEEVIKQRKNLVTASYVSPQMRALDSLAKANGVTILNEVGLDPGIDHLLIMKAVDQIHDAGGVVEELVSLCGGLPDPVAADNPLRYKFSWSPKGVLSACGNAAQYLEKGKLASINGEDLLLHAKPTNRFPTLRLEVIPNRDSLIYRELYSLTAAKSFCRGTLRYEGWSNAMYALRSLGLFKSNETNAKSSKELIQACISDTLSCPLGSINEKVLRAHFFQRGVKDIDGAMEVLAFLDLLSDNDMNIKNKNNYRSSPIDSICEVLENKLQFKDGEKDMVAMFHTVVGRMPNGHRERHTSRLLSFGSGTKTGDTAMAATVGYTTGAAAELVLNGKVESGVLVPTKASLYNPILQRLKEFGITWADEIQVESD